MMSTLSLPSPEFGKNRLYARSHSTRGEWIMAAKGNGFDEQDFGKRLARLRKEAGYTQLQLAHEIGVSRRMIAYYEGETERPPTKLLPDLAAALGLTTDALLGVAPKKKAAKPDRRLQRRMQQIEKMNPREKRQVLQILDAFIEREQLRTAKG